MAKRVVITGVAGGIGRAAACAFAAQGFDVLGIDKESRPADVLVDDYLQFDLAELTKSPGASQLALDRIVSWCSGDGIVALVNNAAVQICKPVELLDVEDWEESLRVNLLAPFFLVQRLLPQLEQASGCVINVSSIHARATKPEFVAYATSKAALSGMTRAMAVDLGHRVRVNAIEPAAVETEMLKASFHGREQELQMLADCHPQGRLATPAEVAALMVAMATGEFRFMHGACIELSGGVAARLHDPV